MLETFKGYGAACLTGIEYCKNKDFEVILFIDGDYSDYPEEAQIFLNQFLKINMILFLAQEDWEKEKKEPCLYNLKQAVFWLDF